MAPDTPFVPWDGSRLSASAFPRQGWPRLSPSYAPPADAGSSRHAGRQHLGSPAEQSDRSHRQSSLRRESEHPQPSSRPDQGINSVSSRPSTVPTQPVLVRAYSGNAEGTTAKQSIMSPRRLFPFTGSKSSAPTRPSGPPLPTDEDFSIESILQAIEPDIRGTLDSIAEICGRSKLSLANEYGSHIAPLGEIRAPPGGLGAVEEASSSDERRADEGVIIFDDDPNIMEAGRDLHPFSFQRYMETFRQAPTVERNGTGASLALRNTTGPVASNELWDSIPDMDMPSASTTRDFVSKPKNSGRDLLARTEADVATPAVVSEVHLDAQANDPNVGCAIRTVSGDPRGLGQQSTDGWQAPEVIRSLLGWLKWTARVARPESRPAFESAEGRLRAMLAQSLNDGVSLPPA
ncbi:hypothetical protein N7492_000556 [Penicillium capsulatum]|uniref:Uncharacterized protein n=1 Tax=Penicillium capsulatum TaxID=69766 RepID=A0A9W9ITS0_9EURO|nr:hypothetical protein N7492_000556 [Penicillium capsulatum]KAJ6130386.1 hypothetical protein N7512_003166 [Penicillium capsulatum]